MGQSPLPNKTFNPHSFFSLNDFCLKNCFKEIHYATRLYLS